MEQRLTFTKADLNYLANLCHNCGECLYACQYAPPHEFAINVPKTLATIRLRSYEEYAWPRSLAAAFRHHNLATGSVLALAMIAVMLAATLAMNGSAVWNPGDAGDFYAVVPHGVMVALFGGVGFFVVAALGIGVARCRRDMGSARWLPASAPIRAASAFRLEGNPRCPHAAAPARDRRGLRHRRRGPHALAALVPPLHLLRLHALLRLDVRRRALSQRWMGRALRLLEPSRRARHGRWSWACVVGPVGLLLQRRRRDPALTDPAGHGLDASFLVLLLLTSLTGLLLLVLRHQAVMGVLLIVHLGIVLALFLTLPYGKFVHGFYRTVALLKYAREDEQRT